MHKNKVVLILTGALVALATASLSAQVPAGSAPVVPTNAAPTAAGAPKAQFAATTFDFGRVPAGEVVHVSFVLTNTGTAPLEITDVRPGCGCTTAGTWDRRVEPGKSATLALQLNTANFGGPIMKNATVTCNDPAQPTVVLLIKGEVWKPVDVQPNIAMFTLTAEQTNTENRAVRVINNTGQDITLEDPISSHPAFRTTTKVIRPGREFEIEIAAVPPLAAGTVQGAVTVKTSSTNTPVISFPVIAIVQPALMAVPSEVVLPAGPLSAPTQLMVSVRNNGTDPVTVSDPSLSVSNATVSLTPVQAGRFYNLALSFPAGFQLKPGELGLLAFKTSNPRVPSMQVPIRMPATLQPVSPPVAVPH